MYMEINEKLAQDISSYCKLNELDEDKYLNDLIRSAFMIDKYGTRPSVLGPNKQNIDQETEREIIVSNYSFRVEFHKDKKTTDNTVSIEDKPKKRTRKLEAK